MIGAVVQSSLQADQRVTGENALLNCIAQTLLNGQDDKVAGGLARLNEEDVSFTLVNNAETHQMVISGAGDIQVDVLCAKLKSRFGVETELKPARVAYR